LIETAARIVRLEGGAAWVASEAPSSCGACGGKGCGSSLFSRVWHPREPEYRVLNPIGADLDERVVVGLPDGALVKAATASYLMPISALLLGAMLGNTLYLEPGAVLGGLLGLALAGLLLRHWRGPSVVPVILRRSTDEATPTCSRRAG